jgi:L-cystine uptake protein TcyP (sodium:dicarboxylate symporter family)
VCTKVLKVKKREQILGWLDCVANVIVFLLSLLVLFILFISVLPECFPRIPQELAQPLECFL